MIGSYCEHDGEKPLLMALKDLPSQFVILDGHADLKPLAS